MLCTLQNGDCVNKREYGEDDELQTSQGFGENVHSLMRAGESDWPSRSCVPQFTPKRSYRRRGKSHTIVTLEFVALTSLPLPVTLRTRLRADLRLGAPKGPE